MSFTMRLRLLAIVMAVFATAAVSGRSSVGQRMARVEQYGVYEAALTAAARADNPYVDLSASVEFIGPDGRVRTVPAFWDGGATWRVRISPDAAGEWRWRSSSADAGLDGREGRFRAVRGAGRGGLRAMRSHPHHFERQDGSRFYFLGDTAWALFTDHAGERHDRAAAEAYLDARAAQGFTAVHAMLLSEAGWGNAGGPPFHDIAANGINPGYWQEVDTRLAYANARGLIVGLAVAWGDKGRGEPWAWRRFPDLDARRRYARYVAARYGAYDVYFLVSGEWHAEVRARQAAAEDVRREFIELGRVLDDADPHDRPIGIHPMTEHGSVREFNEASWMAFGDYQQNYRDLHGRARESRRFGKPVVNSEYGYFLRDQNGDGTPDKDNSTSLDAMRHATWDIVMAGAYLVTGFGTTYFGGHRDPGPFDLTAGKNGAWEAQVALLPKIFTTVAWWELEPRDDLVTSAAARGGDRKELDRTAPPATTFWCLAAPGRQYVVYGRGLREPIDVALDSSVARSHEARLIDLRTGAASVPRLHPAPEGSGVSFHPRDDGDWLLIVTRRQATPARAARAS